MIIEVETHNGSTIVAFEIKGKDLEIGQVKGCEVADSDDDYIFGTDQQLIRIQRTSP